jgi:hypothetical protein
MLEKLNGTEVEIAANLASRNSSKFGNGIWQHKF